MEDFASLIDVQTFVTVDQLEALMRLVDVRQCVKIVE